MDDRTKVFGVGMNKTGTSSLRHALEALGITPTPRQSQVARAGIVEDVMRHGEYESSMRFAEGYRGLEDRPWNVGDMYRRLDERFPDSRFVLTVRDEERWWRSVERWLTVVKPEALDRYLRHLGASRFDREQLIAGYRRHNRSVQDYFRERAPERLLVIDIEGGDGWEPLCRFLEKPVPDRPFPHRNRQGPRTREARQRSRQLCFACGEALRPPEEPAAPGADRRRHSGPRWRRLRDGLIEQRERSLDERALRRAADPARAARRLERLRTRAPGLRVDDLAAVCCFFNPGDSPQRLDNYRVFAEGVRRAGVPLLTVELAFGDRPHALPPEPGEVVRLRADSVMWQKERLLNLGIQELLRRGHEKIAWLDADIRFLDDAWPWHVAEALEHARVVQVFERVFVEQGAATRPLPGVCSIKHYRERGRLDGQRARSHKLLRRGYPAGYSGYGWAARAEVLRQVPLYDAAPVGGGDKLVYLASLPGGDERQHAAELWFRSNLPVCPACGYRSAAPRWRAHYEEWAERWSKAVDARIGFAGNTITDTFHGSRARRRYASRQENLLRHDYDPARDLRSNADGCLEWAPEKPELREGVEAYLRRREGV